MHVLIYLDLSISTATNFIFLSNKEKQINAHYHSLPLFLLKKFVLIKFVLVSTAQIDLVMA